jgi:hypothetical protein
MDTANQPDTVSRLRALIDGGRRKMFERDPDVREHVVTDAIVRFARFRPER